MLGYTHAVSGALGWLIVAPLGATTVGRPLTVGELAAGTLACAGAALVPDLDHPQATVSNTFGPVSKAVARFTALASGGHRNGTHTILFALGAGLATSLIVSLGKWPAWTVMFILAAFAIRGLNLVPPKWSGSGKTILILFESALLVWGLSYLGITQWWWLGPAMMLGCLLHLTGDCCTPERCPLLKPFTKKRFGYGVIAHTGNWAEKKLIAPALILGVFVMLYFRFVQDVKQLWNG